MNPVPTVETDISVPFQHGNLQTGQPAGSQESVKATHPEDQVLKSAPVLPKKTELPPPSPSESSPYAGFGTPSGLPELESGQLEQGVALTWGEGVIQHYRSELNKMANSVSVPLNEMLMRNYFNDKYGIGNNVNEKLTPDELNTRFPGMSQPFTEPTEAWIAETRYDKDQESQAIQKMMSRSLPDQQVGSVMAFGAGLGGFFSSPENWLMIGELNRAARATTGLAKYMAGTLGVRVAPWAATAGKVGLQLANYTAQGFIPAEVQNEINKRTNQAYMDTGDLLAESAKGAVYGMMFHAVGSQVVKFIKKLPLVERIKMLSKAAAQDAAGLDPENSAEMEHTKNLRAGYRADGTSPEPYREFISGEERRIYASKQSGGQYVTNESGKYAGADHFEATDNPQSKINENPDTVQEITLDKDTKLVNADAPIESEEGKIFKQVLEEVLGKDAKTGETIGSTIQTMESANSGESSPIEMVNKKLRELGYAGYRYVEDHGDGIKDNRFEIFKDSKLNETNSIKPDTSSIPQEDVAANEAKATEAMNGETEAQAKRAPEEKRADKAHESTNAEQAKTNAEKILDEKLDWHRATLTEEAEAMAENGDERMKNDLEKVNEDMKKEYKTEPLLKKIARCLRFGP